MTTTLILKRSTAASSHYTKIFKSIRSVSAIPCVQRSFNTNASQVSAYEDFHSSIDEDRSSGSSGFRRRDNDFFSGEFHVSSIAFRLTLIFICFHTYLICDLCIKLLNS